MRCAARASPLTLRPRLLALLTDAACPLLAGTLFDAALLSPAAASSVNLAEPGPRACTRLWASVLESLACLDQAVGRLRRRRLLLALAAAGGAGGVLL